MNTRTLTRRNLLRSGAVLASGEVLRPYSHAFLARSSEVPGKYAPTWESLKQWRMPEWFRDAKFGIWAHWTAQCVPEQGDWYARQMYVQGHPQYDFHCKTYGHPSKVGFKDIDHLWKAERWQPEQLMDLYVKAGARYFYALGCHHDNLDCFASSHHAWNTVNIGPKRDIVGTWATLVRERGLRFGISNHASHAWHWLQTAYGYDAEGPLAGVRYDAFTQTKADGRDQWWDGLDPQDLYTGRNMVIPDGLKTIAEVDAWHMAHDRKWIETPPPNNPSFTQSWFLRCKEMIDKYKPDMLYFDDTELPLGQTGLDLTAYYYNAKLRWTNGREEAVVAAKQFTPEHAGATMLDIERGRSQDILPAPWQTDTCIGDWHYKRSLFERHAYRRPDEIAKTLVDIVSKNGNLMLNIPLRGDGTIDEDEHKFLEDIGRWIAVHGEAIYGTRPFAVYGEGAADVADSRNFNEHGARPLNSTDIRYTQKNGRLFAFVLGWPADRTVIMRRLARGNTLIPHPIQRVTMFGAGYDPVPFRQDGDSLRLMLGTRPESQLDVYAFELFT